MITPIAQPNVRDHFRIQHPANLDDLLAQLLLGLADDVFLGSLVADECGHRFVGWIKSV